MKFRHFIPVLLICIVLSGCSKTRQEAPSYHNHVPKQEMDYRSQQRYKHYYAKIEKIPKIKIRTDNRYTLPFHYDHGHKVFVMSQLDPLGRAGVSHIQLKKSQLPKKKRGQFITVRPSGWHNYKFTTIYHGRKHYVWLFNRGHLVGYQFCGLNNEKRNLITETAYMNQGSLHGMDDHNNQAMLMYENTLRKWIDQHPRDSLDYSVKPIYRNATDLVPESVVLTFVGYNQRGKKMQIEVKHGRQQVAKKISWVTLPNVSPQAEINYRTGVSRVFNENGRIASRG